MDNRLSMPLPIGAAAKAVVIDCIRKWSAGATLNERERSIMDEALALNRLDMLHALFSDREDTDAEG